MHIPKFNGQICSCAKCQKRTQKRQNEMEDGKLELTTITKSITHHLDNCRLFRQFSQSSFQHKYYHQTISFGPQKPLISAPIHLFMETERRLDKREGIFRQSDRQTDRQRDVRSFHHSIANENDTPVFVFTRQPSSLLHRHEVD